MNDRAQEVADALLGTRNDLHDHADYEEMRDPYFASDLAEIVSRCDDCKVWAPTDECIIDDDSVICGDCWDA